MELELTPRIVALIDPEDFDAVSAFKWRFVRIRGHNYAVQMGPHAAGTPAVPLHRFIVSLMGLDATGMDVDHINGDGLDNRRANLRVVTHAENLRNRGKQANNKSGYKGVHWHSRKERWVASIRAEGKNKWLGSFKSPQEAALAYDRAARLYHGEFAVTNFGDGAGKPDDLVLRTNEVSRIGNPPR